MADKPSVILVPIGFSEQSLMALDQAVIFAKAMQAEITLLTVINDDSEIRKALDVKVKDQDILREQAKKKLEELAQEYSQKSGVTIERMVANGVVYEEIRRVADLLDAELVIMGTNGKPSNLRKRFIGSNAYRTVTIVEAPVITIKGVRNINRIDTIIFPLVLDRRSKQKVGPALHYARLFNAKIKVVSVLKDAHEERDLNANLRQVHKFITEHGVECSTELLKPTENKSVVRNTLYYAYENNGDLIMIVEDDRERDITDYFLGTDVQAMIYHSEIPVMSITPTNVKWQSMWEAI